ncbi:MAG: hypothetical protein AB1847_17025 [bacterium]
MSWNELTVGKKIALGFGAVLCFLVAVGELSYTGIGGIAKDAQEMITGNRLDSILAQKELDHLNMVKQINAFLSDGKDADLDVEADHRQCSFGRWFYGDGRREADLSGRNVPIPDRGEKTPDGIRLKIIS